MSELTDAAHPARAIAHEQRAWFAERLREWTTAAGVKDSKATARLMARWNTYGRFIVPRQVEHFRRDMKKGRVVELHDTSHGDFLFDPMQQSIIVREMRRFLLNE